MQPSTGGYLEGRHKLKEFIGHCCYIGFLPNAPGTWGSITALVPIYLIHSLAGLPGIIIFTLACSVATLWVSPACEAVWGQDPSPLVMDEWAGQAMAFAAIPFAGSLGADLLVLISGFILFRFFDIKKPLGINKLQTLSGGWGILLDDLLAGFFAFICLRFLIFIV